ncbi:MAG: Gfo/Idh/MocA family oxidoreductase [Planctomycetaceae bacterium]|nr:Gfo/Idh/MocA family oxidoreductase [Planctomycetaceae bacterium]
MAQINRRNFLKTSAVIAAPWIVPSTCFGANERVAVGCIGLRNQGAGNLKRFLGAGCEISALCDVDSHVLNDARKTVSDKGRDAIGFKDYRKLLDRNDVDAVVITVPDHWHALMTIHACQAGKDVYCEKPLSLTINEGRRMVTAAREHNRIVQTGSQQRSSAEFWKACSLIRNGALGKLERILVGIPKPNHPGPIGPETSPPGHLDYDMWLGPAPRVPYHEKRVHYNFRFSWDYSAGQITNFGAHHLDIAQWALGMDNGGPIAAQGEATFHPERVHEVTEICRIEYTYDNGVQVVLGQQQKDIPGGVTFIGEKGRIFVTRGKLTSDPAEILEQKVGDLPLQLPLSTNHVANFLECMKSRKLPICDVEIGHRSATVCHIGNIVARLGRGVKWDPKTEAFQDDAEAQSMTDRPYREPWSHDMPLARR